MTSWISMNKTTVKLPRILEIIAVMVSFICNFQVIINTLSEFLVCRGWFTAYQWLKLPRFLSVAAFAWCWNK